MRPWASYWTSALSIHVATRAVLPKTRQAPSPHLAQAGLQPHWVSGGEMQLQNLSLLSAPQTAALGPSGFSQNALSTSDWAPRTQTNPPSHPQGLALNKQRKEPLLPHSKCRTLRKPCESHRKEELGVVSKSWGAQQKHNISHAL